MQTENNSIPLTPNPSHLTPHLPFIPGGPLAQLVEQLTLNQRAVGSTPTRPTKTIKHLQEQVGEIVRLVLLEC